MKKEKTNVPIELMKKNISKGTQNIKSKRHNSTGTFSLSFYKPIGKYEIK